MSEQEKLKLKEAEKKRIRGLYPLMDAALQRAGNIMRVSDMVAAYGETSVQLAIQENIFTQTIIKKRSPDNSRPDEIIPVVKNSRFNGDRPAWLGA